VDVRRCFALIALLVVGCGGSVLSTAGAPSAGPSAGASALVAEKRREDLDQLVERLVAIHPNPFLDEGEAAFRARVDAVAAHAAERSDAGFLVDVMGLMGHRQRDGHSGAWAMAQQGDRVHVLPVWLREFPDGLRVVAARPPLTDLVGGIVASVGGTPVEQARRLVTPIVPADNDSNRRGNLPVYLLVKEVIDELGIQRPGAAPLSLHFDDGITREVEADAVSVEAFRDWVFSVYPRYPTGLPPDDEGTRDRQRRAEAFWTEPLPDGTLYVAYHEVRSMSADDLSIGRLANDVEAAENGVVIDLRSNPGGDNTTYRVLRDAVREQAGEGPGRVALLTSRDTFSAAGNFVTELKVGEGGGDILLVGEPPGGGLDIYGDTSTVTLKHSGIVVLISRRYHEKAPGDDRLQIEPDVPVEATWADVVAGRDTVLEAALDALEAVREEAAP
jgi:hypothetical protein